MHSLYHEVSCRHVRAMSENCFKVTHKSQDRFDAIIRENYALLDEMEPEQNAYPV